MTQSWGLLCATALTLVAMSTAVPEGEIVDPQDPEVRACASFALESLSFHDKAHQYSIRRVVSVSKAPIGGGQYDMDVEVKKIPCGPEGVDACTPGSANGQTLRCKFVVLTAPWKRQRVLLSSSCSDESQS